MFTELEIKNFKCLRDVKLPLSPLTVLIGKNDTGKSSVLEALHLLGTLSNFDQLEHAFPEPRTFRALSWRGLEPPQVSLSAKLAADPAHSLPAEASYGIVLGAGDYDRPRVLGEALSCGRSAEYLSAIRAGTVEFVLSDSRMRQEAHTAGPFNATFKNIREESTLLRLASSDRWNQYPTARALADALRATPPFHLRHSRVSEPSPFVVGTVPLVQPDGFGLPSALQLIAGTDRTSFDRIEEDLRRIAPGVDEVIVRPVMIQSPAPPMGEEIRGPVPGYALSFRLAKTGYEIEAPLISEGILLILTYLTLAHSSGAPRVLLLEEPENAIHPRQLEKIVGTFRRLSTADRPGGPVQLIVSTHSPYLLDFVKPEEVLALGRRPNGETIARRLSELPGVPERLADGMTLGELWFNVGEDRLFGDLLK
ncbi:MAG TPA: AAA family ATPase [Planctomycetota bacterium]|nr:AAA family ATPase [Planctomycetota bacterium]